MTKNIIVNGGIRLTRKCNMKCNYCNIQNTQRDDLSLEEWKKAINIMKDLGVKKLVILGGEPTVYPEIVNLVDYVANELNIACNLTTNAFDNFDIVKKLLEKGLNSIGVSIDNLEIKNSISPLKSKKGLELIDYLKENCDNPKIVNYTVLNKKNLNSVISLIEYMNSISVETYLLPLHWGNEGEYEHRKNNEQIAIITDEDISNYQETIDKIIELKRKGYKIRNSIEYLEATKKHIKNFDWKCNGLSELRIDADGKLVCCCDLIGEVNNKYTIYNLKDYLEEFFELREKDSKKCKGCLWGSSFEAELERNILNG